MNLYTTILTPDMPNLRNLNYYRFFQNDYQYLALLPNADVIEVDLSRLSRRVLPEVDARVHRLPEYLRQVCWTKVSSGVYIEAQDIVIKYQLRMQDWEYDYTEGDLV